MILADRIQSCDQKVKTLEIYKQTKDSQLSNLISEQTQLKIEADLLSKVQEVLLQVASKSLGDSTKKLDQLTTIGLKTTFDDLDLHLVTVTDRSRGKTAIEFKLYHNGHTFPIDDSFGGGIMCMTGFLMRVMVIMTFGLRRIILLDETFAHLSEKYHSNASRLIKKIVSDLGFKVILVTHQPAFAEFADNHYKIETGPNGAYFRKGS